MELRCDQHLIMRYRFGPILMTATAPLFISTAHADIVTYHLTAETLRTLDSLGAKFITVCVVLAMGMVAAAFVARKK